MRIIAGAARGRRIRTPKRSSVIKPILSRARQSLFDSIRPRLQSSHFLDLYAGTGIVGLEALSRGAQFVVFVEQSKEGLKLIGRNLQKLHCSHRAWVVAGDVLGGSLTLARLKLPKNEFFDLVFAAPPYLGKDRRGDILVMSIPTLDNLAKSNVLAHGAWVIIQHHKKEPWGALPQNFEIIKQNRFGESLLTYLRFKEHDIPPSSPA